MTNQENIGDIVNRECGTKRSFSQAKFSGTQSSQNWTVADILPPLSMSQEMLMLCFLSGQVEASAWREHLEEDQILAAHFSLAMSRRQSEDQVYRSA